MLDSHSSLGIPKADPETKTCIQVVYLGGHPPKAWSGQSEMEKKEKPNKLHVDMKVTAVGN